MTYCTQCGTKATPGARYCADCGAPLVIEPAPSSAHPESAPSTAPPQGARILAVPQVRPWVRFWARMFDVSLMEFLLAFLLVLIYGMINPDVRFSREDRLIFGMLGLFIWISFEAVLLSTLGTTPGKWMLRTRVCKAGGGTITFGEALFRAIHIWWRGMGAGVPVVSLVTLAVSYARLCGDGITPWDRAGGFIVIHEKIGLLRVFALILYFVLVLLVSASTSR